MVNQMKRKCLAVGIILLFVGTCIIPANGHRINELPSLPISAGNTIYVDDDNVNGPWDGTIIHPFLTIKDGYNAANNGNTIFVFCGNYSTGYIKMYKSVSIVGQDTLRTIVRVVFDWSVFEIRVSGVRIEKLTLIGSGDPSYDSGTIEVYGDRCIIKNNNFIDGEWATGVIIYSGDYNIIKDNSFRDNHDGIALHNARCCLITNNEIIQTGQAFSLERSSHNIISENDFHTDIVLSYSPNNIFSRNNIYGEASFSSYIWGSINFWRRNYWGESYSPFKVIKGTTKIPVGIEVHEHYPFIKYKTVNWYNYDWQPAQEPYDITRMT